MDDPILRAAVLFTRNHQRLIALLTVVGTIGGLLYGMIRPRTIKQRAVLMSATTAKDGPIEDMGALATRLEQLVLDSSRAGTLGEYARLEAKPIVGQPPSQEDTNLIELVAISRSEEETRRTIEAVGANVQSAQGPALKEERERLTRHANALRSTLERLEKQRITTEHAPVYMQLIRELIDTERLASPARAVDSSFLAIYAPRKQSILRAVALPGLIGFLGGLGAGYGAAFFVVALRTISRERKSKNGRAS